MKLSQYGKEPEVCKDNSCGVVVEVLEPEDDETETKCYDDDDWWEAIDLLEGTLGAIKHALDNCEMTQLRRQLLQHHYDDVYQFLDPFLVLDKKNEAK